MQHDWFELVSQSLDCAHCEGQAAVAVQTGVARSVQHLGVAPEQSLSLPHVFGHAADGAQTVCDDAGFAAQQASPCEVLQSLSLWQKRGHSEGFTHAFPSPPKSQQSWPVVVQSESTLQLFGQLVVQTAPPPTPPPLEHAAATTMPTTTDATTDTRRRTFIRAR